MVRVCFIGDSHLAALKYGLREMGDEPGIFTVFYGAPGREMRNLVLADGELTGSTAVLRKHLQRTGGSETIDGTYDLYVIHALQCSVRSCPGAYRALLSETRQAELPVEEPVGATLAGRTVRLVQQITRAPIILSAGPMLAESRRERAWERWEKSGDDKKIAALFDEACRTFAASAGVQFLPQRPETLASALHTRGEYAVDPARFHVDGPLDGAHLNAAYGAIVMRQIFEVARGLRPSPAEPVLRADSLNIGARTSAPIPGSLE